MTLYRPISPGPRKCDPSLIYKSRRCFYSGPMQRRKTLIQILGTAALAFALMGFMFLETALAPKADLWPRWQAFNAASTAVIDHGPWDRFLKAYLKTNKDGVNRVLYGRVSDADKAALHGYINRLRLTPIEDFNRAEQMAYWINLYNALTVRLVLEYYPIKSIKEIDISSAVFGGPWDRKLLDVRGVSLSLNDIEHRILRSIWRDPRIHYAVNCAAIGCPDLLPLAFTGANADTLLDLGGQNFINHRRGARVEDGRLIVSKIYAWVIEDFGGNEEGVNAHLRYLAEPPLARVLKGRTTIEDYEYDWGLNDAGS